LLKAGRRGADQGKVMGRLAGRSGMPARSASTSSSRSTGPTPASPTAGPVSTWRICRRVIDRHGGSIIVVDNPGGGSRFSFTVPGAPVATPAVVTAHEYV
jgi:hypothetical protein